MSVARAGDAEAVEMSLYAPMRDGPEAFMVGLFADWREIRVAASREYATVLGMVVEVADIVRNRKWACFNALKKPDCTIVNFMPLDPRNRGAFKQLEDGMWCE